MSNKQGSSDHASTCYFSQSIAAPTENLQFLPYEHSHDCHYHLNTEQKGRKIHYSLPSSKTNLVAHTKKITHRKMFLLVRASAMPNHKEENKKRGAECSSKLM